MCSILPYVWDNAGSVDVFWDGEYDFSTVGVGTVLRNGCGIQGQKHVALLQGSEAEIGLQYRSLILCI